MARKIQNIKPKQVVDTVADVAPENLAAKERRQRYPRSTSADSKSSLHSPSRKSGTRGHRLRSSTGRRQRCQRQRAAIFSPPRTLKNKLKNKIKKTQK